MTGDTRDGGQHLVITREDIRREFFTEKPCAPQCTISCVHQTSLIDFFRGRQRPAGSLPTPSTSAQEQLVQIE